MSALEVSPEVLLVVADQLGLTPPPWHRGAHAAQLAVLADTHARKAVLAGRRGGKTDTAIRGLLDTAHRHPGSIALYLALTARSARDILWRSLASMNAQLGLGLVMNNTSLTARCSNGSEIHLAGADAEHCVERLRGQAYARTIIDEAASFGPASLRYLVEEVLEPALLDWGGDIWLVGTPGAVLAGPFYEATVQGAGHKSWPTYRWTMRQNPKFAATADQKLATVREERGWTEATPAYRREYLGEWCRDENALVFSGFEPARNMVVAPGNGLQYVIAIDLGASAVRETTAATVIGYTRGGNAYVVSSEKRPMLTPSEVGGWLEQLERRYHPHAIVCDQGGLGKGYIEEIRRRFRIPVKEAEKNNKMGYVDLINGDLRTGKLRIVEPACGQLLEEMAVLQWSESRDGYDGRFADHCCDAMLYAWRECRHYVSEDAAPEQDTDRFEAAEDEDDLPWWKR
mgnify:CR=1 FL=1